MTRVVGSRENKDQWCMENYKSVLTKFQLLSISQFADHSISGLFLGRAASNVILNSVFIVF
jgi:hypothetical protein